MVPFAMLPADRVSRNYFTKVSKSWVISWDMNKDFIEQIKLLVE